MTFLVLGEQLRSVRTSRSCDYCMLTILSCGGRRDRVRVETATIPKGVPQVAQDDIGAVMQACIEPSAL